MISAEQRAKEICDAIFVSGTQWGEHDWKYGETLITTAILEAENAKLEEAAAHVGSVDIKARLVDFSINGEKLQEPPGNTHFIPLTEGPKIVAFVQSEIRSLISKKD